MEYFLDTANLDQIRYWQELSLVDGVTTNPALLAKEGVDPIEQITRIAKLVTNGPISAEITLTDPKDMIKQGLKLSKIAENIIIKIPAGMPGIPVARALIEKGIGVNITLVFHATQAMPYIKLGSDYISIFVGRVEDFGFSNIQGVSDAREIIDASDSRSKVLAASIRSPMQLMDCVSGGAHALTVPPGTWQKVFNNPMYHSGDASFMESWQSLPKKVRAAYDAI
ncbi:MAG: fructose-6-phosphate aldolase, partial [Magnetococcales bacterium]|nr:fructose-6-phosphate aldolase [Magnetococcales bacterium]